MSEKPSSARMPALYISHGSPMTAILPTPANAFLKSLGQQLPRPKAILVVSAHWETDQPEIGATERIGTIHDFYGFPPPLYQLRYAAKGAPELAGRVAELLEEAGFAPKRDPERGLDHGAWVPLLLAYPQADIPVLQLSMQTELGPAHHVKLGQALRPLRDEGVLIIGSGSLTHNLHQIDRSGQGATPAWAKGFADWVAEALKERRDADLIDYRLNAPEARRNHPTDEHFQPIFVALGAATPGVAPVPMFRDFELGSLAMDTYRFD